MRSARPTAAAAFSVNAVSDLVRQHAHLCTRHCADERQVLGRARAGIAIAGQRDAHAALDQSPRRCVVDAEEERGPRQQRCHCAGSRQRVDPRIADAQQMIGRHRSEPRRQLRPTQRRQLIGVQLEPEPQLARPQQHALRFGEGEDARLAEYIAELRQPTPRNLRQHLVGRAAADSLHDHRETPAAPHGRRETSAPIPAAPRRSIRR